MANDSRNSDSLKENKGVLNMETSIPVSRILSILTTIAAVITFAAHYLVGVIPAEYMPFIAGIGLAITAFTERVQGGASKV